MTEARGNIDVNKQQGWLDYKGALHQDREILAKRRPSMRPQNLDT